MSNYTVTIDRKKYLEASRWAHQQFGSFPPHVDRRYTSCQDVSWFVRYYKGKERFYFKKEQDALMFALKFGSV